MPLRFTVVVILGLLAGAELFEAHGQGNEEVWIDGNEVWMKTPGGSRRLTHDAVPKRLAGLAPSGKRIVYLVDDWSSDPEHRELPKEDVVEIDIEGNVLRHMTPDAYVPKPFERLEWIDDQRIGAMTCGHANCFYWILDADSGATLKEMGGGFDFLWSHDRKFVARWFVDFLDAPYGIPRDELDGLMLNETWIYPPSGETEREMRGPAVDTVHGHSFGPFTWSPHDTWLGFVDTVTPEGDPYVVLASPTGIVLRDTLPVDVEPGTRVDWTDDTHLKVVTGGRTFSFVVDGMDLRETTASEKE